MVFWHLIDGQEGKVNDRIGPPKCSMESLKPCHLKRRILILRVTYKSKIDFMTLSLQIVVSLTLLPDFCFGTLSFVVF
jgi:hypothetical protein